MSVFKLINRLRILKYSLLNIRRLRNKGSLSYEEKYAFISAIAEYLFAFYAAYGKPQNDDEVDMVVDNFLHEFTDIAVKDDIRNIVDLRNLACHYTYLPDVIKKVNNAWSNGLTERVCDLIESGLPYDESKKKRIVGISPYDLMSGE